MGCLLVLPVESHLTDSLANTRSRGTPRQCHSNPLRGPLPRAQYVYQASLTPFGPRASIHTPRDANVQQNTRLTQITVGWTASADPGFGRPGDDASIKARLINLVSSVRTLMRCTYTPPWSPSPACFGGVGCRANRHTDTAAVPLMLINTLMIVYLLVLG